VRVVALVGGDDRGGVLLRPLHLLLHPAPRRRAPVVAPARTRFRNLSSVPSGKKEWQFSVCIGHCNYSTVGQFVSMRIFSIELDLLGRSTHDFDQNVG
jgi:hypothetical protein